MKTPRHALMYKGALSSLGFALFYAALGIMAFNGNPVMGVIGLIFSAIFFRDFLNLREAAKEMRREYEQQNS
jgi:hypothetical protein